MVSPRSIFSSIAFRAVFSSRARLQIAIDVVLVTWLVWYSDVINSPYIALYIVVIAVSSLFLGPRDAVVTSVGCAAAFTTCALVLLQRLPVNFADDSLSQTVQSVGLFDIAFLVVGCYQRVLLNDNHVQMYGYTTAINHSQTSRASRANS